MKTIKLNFLLLYISAVFISGSCHSQQSPLNIEWINTKNAFVNGEPIAIVYYVENTSNHIIEICDPTPQARTLKYNMDLCYFDILMRLRESYKRENKILNLDTITNISKFAKNLNRTSHDTFTDSDTLFDHAKKTNCNKKTSHTLQPKERKYFQSIIYNHAIDAVGLGYVRHELVAGDYVLKIRVPYIPQGYLDDSFSFSIYDRSLNQEQEYNNLLDIYRQDWSRYNVAAKNPEAVGKTIEDFIIQYPQSIFVEKAYTLIAGNHGLKDSRKDFKILNEKYLNNINNDALLCYISWLASYYVVEYDFENSKALNFAQKFQMSKFQYFDLMLKNFKNKSPKVSDFLLSAIKYHNRVYKIKSSPNLRLAANPEDYDNLVNYARETETKK